MKLIKKIIIFIFLLGCSYEDDPPDEYGGTTLRFTSDSLILVDYIDSSSGLYIFRAYRKEISDSTLVKEEIYYPNKNIKSKSYYVDGLNDGVYKQWYETENAIRIIGRYKGGKKNGEWKYFNIDSSLRWKGFYKNNSTDGRWEHYNNGLLEQAFQMNNGKMHGYDSIWYTNGNLREVFKYDNGVLIDTGYRFSMVDKSLVKYFFEDGNLIDSVIISQ